MRTARRAVCLRALCPAGCGWEGSPSYLQPVMTVGLLGLRGKSSGERWDHSTPTVRTQPIQDVLGHQDLTIRTNRVGPPMDGSGSLWLLRV